MPAYAYPIISHPQSQNIREELSYFIEGDSITISELIPIVGDNRFDIMLNTMGTGYDITVYTFRAETDEEYSLRLSKEEEYMRNYRIHQAKYRNSYNA